MPIISVANQKGGCGKTTTAINLAAGLALNNKKVLLIDLDPQSHATIGLNIQMQYSIYNVISKLTPRKMNLEDIIVTVESKFDLLPSSILVGTLEQELADEIGREVKLTGVLEGIKDKYDYILIDCPPSLGFLTVNALRASDQVIVPVETSRFSLHGVDHIMDIIVLIRERLSHPLSTSILITMFDSRLRHSFSMLETVKERFRDILLDTMIHLNVKLKESAVMGKTVSLYDKYSRGAKDYFSLARELICRWEKAEEQIPAQTTENRLKEFMENTPLEGLVPMIFTCYEPHAGSVYVSGTFNGWALDDSCRMLKKDGRWVIRLYLKPGVYSYRFVVDGRWQEDIQNPLKERNSFGDTNSLIEVR